MKLFDRLWERVWNLLFVGERPVQGCIDCAKARRRQWAVYNSKCGDCVLRMIACMDEEEREREYDSLEHHYGKDARRELIKSVNIERARIRALKGETI